MPDERNYVESHVVAISHSSRFIAFIRQCETTIFLSRCRLRIEHEKNSFLRRRFRCYGGCCVNVQGLAVGTLGNGGLRASTGVRLLRRVSVDARYSSELPDYRTRALHA